MNWAWTSTIEATPGGESNAAINKRQTGRRRSGRAASATPAVATTTEATQGSGLFAICFWLVDGVDAAVRRRGAATIRLQPILLAAVEIRVQSKELIKRTARDFL